MRVWVSEAPPGITPSVVLQKYSLIRQNKSSVFTRGSAHSDSIEPPKITLKIKPFTHVFNQNRLTDTQFQQNHLDTKIAYGSIRTYTNRKISS